MLLENISLLFKRDKVTDCSKRKFENISGFEYALWALDKHMWKAMISCIPRNEEGKKVLAALIAQYNKVNTEGVTYRLNGNIITEKHFDFENTIIQELQTQVNSINAPGVKNWDVIDHQWLKGFGGALKLLPMHGVYEFCSEEPFYPVPKFISQPKSSQQFFNWITQKRENWFSVDSKLSVEFAMYKGSLAGGPQVQRSAVGRGLQFDLDAMTALWKVRTNDFIALKLQLKNLTRLLGTYFVEIFCIKPNQSTLPEISSSLCTPLK